MKPHMQVVRALSASAMLHGASKELAPPTLITQRPAAIAVASGATISPAAVASKRPTAYPLDGFNYITVSPSNAPSKSEQAQYGTNACAQYGASRQDSMCQNAYLNSAEDFCLWGPPYSNGTNSSIANTERYEVSWCTKPGYGTRLIPDNTFTSLSFVQTPLYVQITGTGNLANIGLPYNDSGGELDPHGDDETGNPQGGLVWSTAFANATGTLTQSHQWTMFIGGSSFCFRVCQDGPEAAATCNHIYDVMGCDWNMPTGPLAVGTFESCKGDAANPPMGVYVENGSTSIFTQGAATTPSAHPAPSSSLCTTNTGVPTNGATVAPLYAALAAAATGGAISSSSSSISLAPPKLSTAVVAVVTATLPATTAPPIVSTPPTISTKSTASGLRSLCAARTLSFILFSVLLAGIA